MNEPIQPHDRATQRAHCSGWLLLCIAVMNCGLLGGCAAITNPVANGIPASLVPPELLADAKEDMVPIPLNLLRRKPPEAYQLGPGDVLGVYIEGVLGEQDQAPPVNIPDAPNLPTALGYPIPVRQNGTVSLPLLSPVKVQGLTLEEAEAAIIKAYTQQEILKPEAQRTIVTLIRPRHVRILVVRQDSASGGATIQTGGIRGPQFGAGRVLGGRGRGTGEIVELSALENDVLSALARTGGLPGSGAANEVVIFRGYFENESDKQTAIDQFMSLKAGFEPPISSDDDVRLIRIPLRVRPHDPPTFRPEDIVLHSGDIVFIDSREAEVFYAAGLLPSGAYPLPRDEDLDVIEAISMIGGPLVNGGVNSNNLSGSIIERGIGPPSPSLLTVLRRTPDGYQMPIRVDLREALRDPRQSLLIQAGDVLVLQETPGQALARYFADVTSFNLFSDLIRRSFTNLSAMVTAP